MAGQGDGLCVYLPGTNFNAATSTGLLGVLASRRRVVCADLPGQPGLSASGRLGDEPEVWARWVAEVIEECRRRVAEGRVVLMGHSRGAAVALAAAPGSVDSLVQLSPAGLARVRVTPQDRLERWRGHRVRILAGERDVFFPPRRLEGPARRHLGERIQVVTGAGHLLVDQRPDAVTAAPAADR